MDVNYNSFFMSKVNFGAGKCSPNTMAVIPKKTLDAIGRLIRKSENPVLETDVFEKIKSMPLRLDITKIGPQKRFGVTDLSRQDGRTFFFSIGTMRDLEDNIKDFFNI